MIEITETAPHESMRARHLPVATVFAWMRRGWADFVRAPAASIAYGIGVFLVSAAVIWTMFTIGADYILFPAVAGFMVVAPFLATGLYEKSRMIAAGEPPSLDAMLLVRARSGAQILFIGVILMLLMLLWMRAAVIVYALFFGIRPFPGLDHIAGMLFTTGTGWAMLATGTLIGGLFAAFAFAIGAVSVPMLLDRRTDAFTAMGLSISTVWNNLPVMIAWGAVVLAGILVCTVTAGLGLIVIFPVLGHATWHVYKSLE